MTKYLGWTALAAIAAIPAAAAAQADQPAPAATAAPAAAAAPVAAPAPVAAAAPVAAGAIPPPPAGQGQVVFFRKGGLIGAAISCAVHENGAKLSSLPPGRYAVIPAAPGIHNYAVRSETTDTLRMEIEPGETYFAQCKIGMGVFAGRPNLSPADQATFGGMKLKPVKKKTS